MEHFESPNVRVCDAAYNIATPMSVVCRRLRLPMTCMMIIGDRSSRNPNFCRRCLDEVKEPSDLATRVCHDSWSGYDQITLIATLVRQRVGLGGESW